MADWTRIGDILVKKMWSGTSGPWLILHMGAKRQLTVSKLQHLPHLTFFLPSNSSNLISFSNEIHSSDLAQGLNLDACLTLGNGGQQNHIYYINCSLAVGYFSFNLTFHFFPSIFELSKRQADLKPTRSCSQMRLLGNILWKSMYCNKMKCSTNCWLCRETFGKKNN